jgi:hypothetical protein
MKKLFVIIMLVIVATIYSNATEVVTDSTQVTFSKVYNDVKEGLSGLATALKAPAEHVYTILVKQQLVNSVSLLIICLLLISPSFTCKFWLKQCKNDPYNVGWEFGLVIIGVIIPLIGIIILAAGMPEIIMGLFNPEYGAIKDIMNFIR